MLLKDFLALAVSGAALLVSVVAVRFNHRTQRRQERANERKAFDEAIAGLPSSWADWGQLRHDLGEAFYSPAAGARRVAIVGRRNLFLSKALRLARTGSAVISSADTMILATTLINIGRVADAIPLYQASMEAAADELETAGAQRVLGRAMLLSGDADQQREEMINAAGRLLAMSRDRGFNHRTLITDVAETYRRLVDASLEAGFDQHLHRDAEELGKVLPFAGEPTRAISRKVLERAEIRLRQHPAERCQGRADRA